MYTKYIKTFDLTAESIARSDILMNYVNNDYYYTDVLHDNSDMFFYLDLISESDEYIDHIMVYDYSFEYLITNKNYYAAYMDVSMFPWFVKNVSQIKPISELDNYCTWSLYKKYVAITYRADMVNESLTRRTFVTVLINNEKFSRLLSGLALTDNSKNAFAVKNDIMLYFDGESDLTSTIKHLVFENFKDLNKGERVMFIHDYQWYYLQYRPLDTNYEAGIVYLIPDSDLITNEYEFMIISSLVISLIVLLLGYVIFRLVLNSNIQKPINQLIKGMDKVGNGDFTYKLDESICKDNDMRGLFAAYNSMTDRVTVLIEELYQAELYRKQLELQALQDKIDPHFLYNTLDTINWTAKEHNVDEISRIVIALSTMYRKIFNRGKDLTTIKDALEGIECYLEIQRIRYGESFSYDIYCPEELEKCIILNLIIQTIVENSIVHGLEDRSSGKLEIRVDKEKDDIIIKVIDNGIGMTEEKLNLINSSINSMKLESESGLRNVQKRIRLYYGMQYGITIESKYKEGTTVILHVPYREKEEDD